MIRRRTIAFALFAVLCILAAASCGSEDTGVVRPPPTGGVDSLIDKAILDSLVMAIGAGEYGNVRSVLVEREGRLVMERYFGGYNRDYLQQVYSVTKSVTSALIGTAIGRGEIAGVDETMLQYFSYYPNYPNPFNPQTTIAFELAVRGRVKLEVFDVAGRLVITLADGDMEAGPHELRWWGQDRRGRPVTSGVYFYRLSAPGLDRRGKMVLAK